MEKGHAQQIIDGIGAISELTAPFYKNLIKNGVPPDHACAPLYDEVTPLYDEVTRRD
jgi:hypothetical protein